MYRSARRDSTCKLSMKELKFITKELAKVVANLVERLSRE